MSHFTVMVIGENPEKLLQPFHEYECTGIKDEYVKFVEAEEDLVAEYEGKKNEYATLDEYVSDWHGYEKIDGKYGRITNPNAKWDWYVLGGRWSGMIKLKKHAKGTKGMAGTFGNAIGIDQAKKGDIKNINDLTTFAVLKGTEWYERGEMGWFGMAINEMDEKEWDAKLKELILSLPDETLISIYDCHI